MLIPLADAIVIRKKQHPQSTKSKIFLAQLDPSFNRGEVLSAGPGKVFWNGTRVACGVKAGDAIVYRKNAGLDVDDGLTVIREDDVIAIEVSKLAGDYEVAV